MKNVVRTRLVAIVVAASMLALAMALTACAGVGADPAKAAKSALTTQLDGIKSPSADEVETLMGSDSYTKLQSYGLDPQAFYQALVTHFSYEVKDVTVDSSGKTATATVSATNLDLEQIFGSWVKEFSEYAMSADGMSALMSGDQDGLVQKGMQMLQADLEKTDAPIKTADVTVDLTKGSDGTWQIGSDELSQILFVGQSLDNLGSSLDSDTSAGSGTTSAATTSVAA